MPFYKESFLFWDRTLLIVTKDGSKRCVKFQVPLNFRAIHTEEWERRLMTPASRSAFCPDIWVTTTASSPLLPMLIWVTSHPFAKCSAAATSFILADQSALVPSTRSLWV